jgi:cytochrome c oxidase cbb3-type subunit 3
MVGTMIWGIWYWFLGYPLNAYSQIGEYNEEVKAYNAAYEAKWANPDEETLLGMGEGTFLVQCAPCHGIAGDGIDGKAQGFDKRMTEEQVLHVIEKGQDQLKYPMGAMPGGMASGDDAKAIASWIAGGMKGEKPASFAACASCHGDDGKGMSGQSPNLASYDEALISHVLEHGKVSTIGTMPAFNDGRITEVQKKAVATYIQSLQE